MSEQTLRAFLEPLAGLLKEPGLTELCVNRPHEVWREGPGGWKRHEIGDDRLSAGGLEGLARLTASFGKQDISRQKPILSATLPDGERCQIVIPPAVPEGTVSVTIRKPSDLSMDLEGFERTGLFERVQTGPARLSGADRELCGLRDGGQWAKFFDLAVKSRKNIVVSGATGSGKTTFAKSLVRSIPAHERVIVIEDVLELDGLPPNHVRLLYAKDGQGVSQAGPKQLLESCLRMRPDRILLQELRDGTAFFYLRNVNSGHPGSITTVHADSARLAFEQLTLLVKESEGGARIGRADIRALLVMLVDVVVQMKRLSGGARRVTEVYFEPEKQLALWA